MNEIIFNNIFEDIVEISDSNFQKEVWLGKNLKKCSSYVEVMCRLFDDNRFDIFVDSDAYEIGFTQRTIIELHKLRKKLKNYKEPDVNDDMKIIADSNWDNIRQIASLVIELWRKDDQIGQLKYKLFNRLYTD